MTDGGADPERLWLFRCVFELALLDEVVEAVSVASATEAQVYVERVNGGWRWSLASLGGPYPLLRVVAWFLQRSHHGLIVGYHTLPNGFTITRLEPENTTNPDSWAIVALADGDTSELIRQRISDALG